MPPQAASAVMSYNWLPPVVAAGEIELDALLFHSGALLLDGVLCVPGDRVMDVTGRIWVVDEGALVADSPSPVFPMAALVEDGETYEGALMVKDDPATPWFVYQETGSKGARPRGAELMRGLLGGFRE